MLWRGDGIPFLCCDIGKAIQEDKFRHDVFLANGADAMWALGVPISTPMPTLKMARPEKPSSRQRAEIPFKRDILSDFPGKSLLLRASDRPTQDRRSRRFQPQS